MGETWLPILGYEGIYEVSNLGNIRSLDRYRHGGGFILGRAMKTSTTMGYPYFNASKDGVCNPMYVHFAVASAFLGARESGKQINHKDGNKRNNCVDNLEYVTPSENMSHAIEHSLNRVPKPDNRGERHGMSKLSNAQVLEIKNDLIAGEPVKEIAQKYNVSKSTIHDIKSGRTWLSIRI